MKIRELQITGKEVNRVFKGAAAGDSTKAIVYIKGFERLTVDTDDGSWLIYPDEIISFIQARRNKC